MNLLQKLVMKFLIIGIGPRDIGFSFRWKWFEIRFDVLDFQPRNLESYRRYKKEVIE